jgi:hypothetical protein
MATHQGSVEGRRKWGRPVWASSEERMNCEAAPLVDSPFGSPVVLTLHSSSLRVGAGKSGVACVSEK